MNLINFLFIFIFSFFAQANSINRGGGLIIAPNPAVSQVSVISNESNKQIKNLSVYNVLGNEITHMKNANYASKLNLDVSRFREGLYVVKVYLSDNTSVVATLIKSV